jgi:hypothetical protein
MSKPKLLFLTPLDLGSPCGSSARMHSCLTELSPHFDIQICCLPTDLPNQHSLRHLMERINGRLFRHFKFALNYRSPLWLGTQEPRDFRAWASEFPHFDVVWVNYAFLSPYLRYLSYGTSVVDTHDLFADKFKQDIANNVRPQFYSTTANSEDKALKRFNHVITIQKKEGQILAVRGVPNTTLPYLPPRLLPEADTSNTQPNTLAYIGGANPYNTAGLSFFLSEVFPRITQHLHIAGSICTEPTIKAWIEAHPELTDRLHLHGFVDCPITFYSNFERVIIPHVGGTGLKIKLIDALSAKRPICASPIVLEGISDLITCPTPETPDQWVEELSHSAVACETTYLSHTQDAWDAFLHNLTAKHAS